MITPKRIAAGVGISVIHFLLYLGGVSHAINGYDAFSQPVPPGLITLNSILGFPMMWLADRASKIVGGFEIWILFVIATVNTMLWGVVIVGSFVHWRAFRKRRATGAEAPP